MISNPGDISKALKNGKSVQDVITMIDDNRGILLYPQSLEVVLEHINSILPWVSENTKPRDFVRLNFGPMLSINEWLKHEQVREIVVMTLKEMTDLGYGSEVFQYISKAFSNLDTDELREAIIYCLDRLSEHLGVELSFFLKQVQDIPVLHSDEQIQDAMANNTPAIIQMLRSEDYEDHPWGVVANIVGIPAIWEVDEIQAAIPKVIETTIEALWTDWWGDILPGIGNVPPFSENPEIRIIVGTYCHMYGGHVRELARTSQEWMSKSIIRAALGESLEKVSDSVYEQEINEYYELLDSHSEPWLILDLIKDVPRIWKDERIQEALERAVPRIADGIRKNAYPLDIVRTLLRCSSMEHFYTGPSWVFKHDELNKAIRESTGGMWEDLSNYHDAPRFALQLALADAGVGKENPTVPILAGPYDQSSIDWMLGIVEIKGWEYVTEKMAEQLKNNPTYADTLVELMPTEFDHYFDERNSFPRDIGFILVELLFPYKPLGYLSAMKVVLEISYTAKGHDWVWEKYEEELEWAKEELGLSIDDFI